MVDRGFEGRAGSFPARTAPSMHPSATIPLLPGIIFAMAMFDFAPLVVANEPQPDPAQIDFFEKKIRPVLVDKCYKCHSDKAEKLKGGLLLDTREGIRRGGDNGPAVVPGNLKESLLVDAI